MTNLLKFVKEITNSIKDDQSVTQGEIPWRISNSLEKVWSTYFS